MVSAGYYVARGCGRVRDRLLVLRRFFGMAAAMRSILARTEDRPQRGVSPPGEPKRLGYHGHRTRDVALQHSPDAASVGRKSYVMQRSIITRFQGNGWLHTFLAPVGGGVLVALITTLMLSTLPLRWTIAVLGGVLILLPVLMTQHVRMYGLGLFLFLLMMEANTGTNLTNHLVDANELTDALGIPPVKTVGILVRPSDVVLLSMLLAWSLRIVGRKERIQLSRPAYFALAYLAWATLSSLIKAAYPFLSIVEFVQQVKYFLLFLYVSNVVGTKEFAKGLTRLLVIFLLVEGAVSLAGLRFQPARDILSVLQAPSVGRLEELPAAFEGDSSGQRAVGTFRDFAVTAMFLHFLLPVAVIQMLVSSERRKKLLYFCILTLGIAALWVTYSRTGLIAAGFGLVCCLYLSYCRGLVSRRHFVLMAYTGVLLVSMMSPLLSQYLKSRPSNFEARFPILREAADLIYKNPILGVGLNNSTAVRKTSYIRTLEQDAQELGSQPIHNHYLVVASETGIIGFIFFIVFFLLTAKEAVGQLKSTNSEIASFILAILSAYAAVSVQLVFDTMGSYVVYTMLFFYAGLIIGFKRVGEEARGKTKSNNARDVGARSGLPEMEGGFRQ